MGVSIALKIISPSIFTHPVQGDGELEFIQTDFALKAGERQTGVHLAHHWVGIEPELPERKPGE